MFDHLVRDGVILLLIGVTVLTKLSPAIRQKGMSDNALKLSLWIGWGSTVVGFVSMICGVIYNSW
ncbi:MAG: hypothetical protein N3B18_04190 [Desulfobacterota bacterium]|nr:hypothetical protein [Thermodesulfobacteriota bacterium]